MQETWIWSLGQIDPWEEETATYSSILVWNIPWTAKPGRLHAAHGVTRVRRDWATGLGLGVRVARPFSHMEDLEEIVFGKLSLLVRTAWGFLFIWGVVCYLIFFETSPMLSSPLIFDDCIEIHEYRNVYSFLSLISSWCTFKTFNTFLLFYAWNFFYCSESTAFAYSILSLVKEGLPALCNSTGRPFFKMCFST